MATYRFSNNIPQSPQRIPATQAPLYNNFQAINEFISNNHVGFNDAVNFGKHNFTTFPFLESDPSTTSSEMAMYAKATGSPNPGEIFIRYPSNGSVVQLSGSSIGQAGASTNGWSYLPTNILMKWGQATGIVSGSNTIIFPTEGSIPAFATSIYIVQYTPSGSYTLTSPTAYITSQTLTQFILEVPSVMSSTISWMAIGI